MRTLAILAVLVVAASAGAQEAPSGNLEKARAHFKVGEGYFRSGAYERAIKEYEAAYALAPRLLLLYNLGSAYRKKAEKTGSIDDKKQAVDYYRKYLDADPGGKAAGDARDFVAMLGKEIAGAQAAVTVTEPQPQAIARPPEPKPVERPPDPRTAPVVTSHPPAPPPPVARPPAGPPPTDVERPGRGAPVRIAGIATAGAGAVLVATGLTFGLKARSIANEVDGLADHWDQDLYDRGKAAQRNAFIFGGAGLAAIAGGAAMYFVFGKANGPPAITVRPSITGSAGTILVTGRL